MLLALALIVAAALTPAGEALAAKKKPRTPSIAAAIVVDMNSGSILQEQAADTPRHPASLTKMMTLYVLFGYMKAGKLTPSSDLTVTEHAASQAPTKLGLKPGATIKVSDAIKALVTQSANDAAATIAENLAGTEENFAKLMTDTGRRIGMRNTLFRNASGLPNDEQITTARDMAILSAHLIHDYPDYYTVFATQYFTFKGRKYKNHNKLLLNYKGTDGIKTGYTRASGYNLAASVHRGDKHLIAVVLGGKTGSQRDTAMRALARQEFCRGVEHQADRRAARRLAGDAGAAARSEEADPRVGLCNTLSGGSNACRRPRRGRYLRARLAAENEPHLDRPVAQAICQAGAVRRRLSCPGGRLHV